VTNAGLQFVVMLNHVANACGQVLLYPLSVLSDIWGALVVALVTGVLLLIAFKYTSNQAAIKKVRDGMKADMLALSLFKDSVAVSLGSQGRIVLGALKLIALSLVPILCMVVPVTLLLGQLSLWWQFRPLQRGETAVITLQLKSDKSSAGQKPVWPAIEFEPSGVAPVTLGPVRIQSKRAVCWNIEARANGYHRLLFRVDGQDYQKDIAIGDGMMRVSRQRHGSNWADLLGYPAEAPFDRASPVQSIEIQYPARTSWGTGGQSWPIYWFVGSSIAAFCLRGVFKVQF